MIMNKKIILAGGCFWGLEDLIRTQPGVIDTEVGYTGGKNENPTYENHPGHAEAVEIEYDSTKTSYKKFSIFSFRFIILQRLISKVAIGEHPIVQLFSMEAKRRKRKVKTLSIL